MAGFTLFPAETGVKLTLQRRAAMIAPMRSRVSDMAICAAVALACNEGLQPTTAAPAIRGTVTYQGHLPDSLRDSTGAVLVVAFATFPQTPADLLHFAAVAFLDTGGPPRRYELRVPTGTYEWVRSEEHTSELQSPCNLVCRLLLEKKKISDQDAVRLQVVRLNHASTALVDTNIEMV